MSPVSKSDYLSSRIKKTLSYIELVTERDIAQRHNGEKDKDKQVYAMHMDHQKQVGKGQLS